MRLDATQLSKVYPGGDGLHGVNLTIDPGEIHALVGLNGAGKSTLMRLLLGMVDPDAGGITINGDHIDQAPASAWSRVGHLIEYPLAYGELTVVQNLALCARLRGLDSSAAQEVSARAIDEFALEKYVAHRFGNLSLGNRQRVGLAAALQHDPSLVILDEPTNALDPSGVLLLREALMNRAARGAAVLVSSHHLDEVARIAERITVINNGRIIGTLSTETPEIERAFFALVHSDSQKEVA